jgi:hypothetical protein
LTLAPLQWGRSGGMRKLGVHMAVMGEASASVWADELWRAGQVVFPLRRRPLLWRNSPGIVPFVFFATELPDALEAGGARRIVAPPVVALVVASLCFSAWQFVTQRPVLTVDHEGIRYGRSRFMPWSEVGAIGGPQGPPFDRSFAVIPNVRAKKLTLRQQNVRDIPAFARWLEELLAHHRATNGGLGFTWQ